jgi:hypothetical protein
MAMNEKEVTPKKPSPIVHGMYAKDFLLPWEDPDEFAALHEGLVIEYLPAGMSEEETIFHIAQLFWKKRRLSRLHTTTALRDSGTQAILATGETSGTVSTALYENKHAGTVVRSPR